MSQESYLALDRISGKILTMTIKRFTVGGMLLVSLFVFLLVSGIYLFTRDIHSYGIGESFARPISEKTPVGLESLKAKDCGKCHMEIYKEWQTTLHAKAWTDDYFQIDWAWDKKQQNCLNCHTPLENQQEYLVTGFQDGDYWKPILLPNPDFDPSFQSEGVTCASCHVKNGKIVGPFQIEEAPHPVQQDPSFSSGYGLCVRCHVIPSKTQGAASTLNVCSTLSEIEANQIRPDCINCHMPRITRSLVPGGTQRRGRQHLWRGGHEPKMVKKALRVEISKVKQNKANFRYEIELTNVGTHHRLPTGTPDRHFKVVVALLEAQIDGPMRVVKSIEHKTIRKILWRPIVVELGDDRLRFNKPYLLEFDFDIPDCQKKYSLKVTVDYQFLEKWRRHQLKLPDDSHAPYQIYEKTLPVDCVDG